MNDYINGFASHLNEGLLIGNTACLANSEKKIKNVLICGLGGSGIGGTIVTDIISFNTDNISFRHSDDISLISKN